jgi:gamma-glutamyltranspeptidase
MKLLFAALLISFGVFAQDDAPAAASAVPAAPTLPPREQARSMIVTQYGIVAASQFLASQAGAKMLESGGNAIDAAIAANAVLGLTQPYVNGLGGDLFAIVYEAKTGKVYGLNSSGWTPKALTIEYLKGKGIDKIDPRGVHTITVPGCVAGWDALRRRFGTKSFGELLGSAVFWRDGFPLPTGARRITRRSEARVMRDVRQEGAAEQGRVQEPGARRIAAADCGEGPRRLLQGEDGREPGEVPAGAGRRAHPGGLRGVRTGMGRADLDDLPRLAGV